MSLVLLIFGLIFAFLRFAAILWVIEIPGGGKSCLQVVPGIRLKYLQGKVIPFGKFLTGGIVREFRERNRYGATP